MSCEQSDIQLRIKDTKLHCPIGEKVGQLALTESRIPVLSCEGACIRGEIARQAANMIAKEEPFARGCHGELMTVPTSAIARWIHLSEKVVVVDGCFLRCHGRALEDLLGTDHLIQFDALSVYKKYNDLFDPDDVPEEERMSAARKVADRVLLAFEEETEDHPSLETDTTCCACG